MDLCRVPLLIKVSSSALDKVPQSDMSTAVTQLQRLFENSNFGLSPGSKKSFVSYIKVLFFLWLLSHFSEVAVGQLSKQNERVLQWFSINLLLHNLVINKHKMNIFHGFFWKKDVRKLCFSTISL